MLKGWNHPMYNRWRAMLGRCYRPSWINFKDYGGRGIHVCQRWRESFWNFWDDMGATFRPGMWLERKDNNGNYEPGNCVWKTPLDQNNNSRANRLLTYDGRTQTVSQWCRELKLNYRMVRVRLFRNWPVHQALGISDNSNNAGKRRLYGIQK